MKRVIVRYKVKPDKAEENIAFIKKVFDELRQKAPDGIRYVSFVADDGVSFTHVASIETDDGSNPLGATDAFKAFQAEIKDRCVEPPQPVDQSLIGSYRAFE